MNQNLCHLFTPNKFAFLTIKILFFKLEILRFIAQVIVNFKWMYLLVNVICMSACFSMRSILRNHRFRRDARTLEDEEEMWFNTDEEDLEDGEAVVPPSDKMKSDEDLMDPISKFMERKKRMLLLHADGTMLMANYYDSLSGSKML